MSDIIKEAREALEGVVLAIDEDGDAYALPSGAYGNLVALPARNDDYAIQHTEIWGAMVARFNAHPALIARAEAAEAALTAERAGLLNDPAAVHINMLRGTIAKPTVEQIVHLYGREAFQPMIDAAIAQALEKACVAVSEHANWPEDEHGRTEQVGLFARVINAIRAIAALPAARIEADAAEIAKLQAELKSVLDREAATQARHDAKMDALEARNAALVEAAAWAFRHVKHMPMDEASQADFARHLATIAAMKGVSHE